MFNEALQILDTIVFAKTKRHLKDVEVIILRGAWQGQSYDDIADIECYAANYLKQDVGPKLWKLLSEVLGEPVSKTNFRAAVERSQLYFTEPRILQLKTLAENSENLSLALTIPVPEGFVPLNSIFYVNRPPNESRCERTIIQNGALIRIKAPRQMGKTSLLERILAYAAKQDYQIIRLNFLQAETAVFSNLDKFLRWFCAGVSYKLQLPSLLNVHWHDYRGSIINCTTYFEDYILTHVNTGLILALDEADRIFPYSEISQEFFAMLRSWHEEAKNIDVWQKLRLIVVHSTENYGALNINQSPFNVGLVVELNEFTNEQVLDLAQRHQLDLNHTQLMQLMAMVGGHPYLIRLALYYLAVENVSLENLLQDAPTDAGIYAEHLRIHLQTLKKHPELTAAFIKVVNATEPIRINTIEAYQLYSMGLIIRKGDLVTPRCQLYQQYFCQHLINIKFG